MACKRVQIGPENDTWGDNERSVRVKQCQDHDGGITGKNLSQGPADSLEPLGGRTFFGAVSPSVSAYAWTICLKL